MPPPSRLPCAFEIRDDQRHRLGGRIEIQGSRKDFDAVDRFLLGVFEDHRVTDGISEDDATIGLVNALEACPIARQRAIGGVFADIFPVAVLSPSPASASVVGKKDVADRGSGWVRGRR